MDKANLKTLVFRVGRKILGIVLILVGIIGCVLPFLPGFLFLIAGIMLLCPESRFTVWAKEKWKKIKIQRKNVSKTDNKGNSSKSGL